MFTHILVATDLGPDAERAVDLAVTMALRDEADLVLVHVFEVPAYIYPGAEYAAVDYLGPLEEKARERFEQLVSQVRKRWSRAQGVFKVGTAWEQILAAVTETHADLVVMGTHGRRGLAHALLGSVAEKVVRLSPVPVLTAREASAKPSSTR